MQSMQGFGVVADYYVPVELRDEVHELVKKHNLRYIGDPYKYPSTRRIYMRLGADDVMDLNAFSREYGDLIYIEEPEKLSFFQKLMQKFNLLN